MNTIVKLFAVVLAFALFAGVLNALVPSHRPGTEKPDTTEPGENPGTLVKAPLPTVAFVDGTFDSDWSAAVGNDVTLLTGYDGTDAVALSIFNRYRELSIIEMFDLLGEESWKGSMEYQEEGTPYSPYDENAEEFEPDTTNKDNCIYLSQYQKVTDSCWIVYVKDTNGTDELDMDGNATITISTPLLQGRSIDHRQLLLATIDVQTLEMKFLEFDSFVDSTTAKVTLENLGICFLVEKTANPTLISFTISGVEYQAELGMTWREWVASRYNTGSWYIDGMYIKSDSAVIANNGDTMEPSYLIWAGTQYTTTSGGASPGRT